MCHQLLAWEDGWGLPLPSGRGAKGSEVIMVERKSLYPNGRRVHGGWHSAHAQRQFLFSYLEVITALAWSGGAVSG